MLVVVQQIIVLLTGLVTLVVGDGVLLAQEGNTAQNPVWSFEVVGNTDPLVNSKAITW